MIYVFRVGSALKTYEEQSISEALDEVIKRHTASYCMDRINLVASNDPEYLGKTYKVTQDGLYGLLELEEIKKCRGCDYAGNQGGGGCACH